MAGHHLPLARIVHLTDLHLFVDPDGAVRPPSSIRASVRFLRASGEWLPSARWRKAIGGFGAHNTEALEALRPALRDVVSEAQGTDVPVVVVQTGDVETFGRSRDPRHVAVQGYPGFAFLRDVVWPELEGLGATCVDLYGNHDVWDGTLPMLTRQQHLLNAVARIDQVPGLQGPWPDVEHPISLANGRQLHLHRLNSVSANALHGTFACGTIGPHPPLAVLPASTSTSAFEELAALASAAAVVGAPPPIRVVAMHHPPHDFDPSILSWIGLATGSVQGADRLALTAEGLPIHLVLAGHRHALDPPAGRGWEEQPPLPDRTGQLAASSPTQDHHGSSRHPNSFSVYDLGDDGAGSLTVDRAVHEYRGPLARVPPVRCCSQGRCGPVLGRPASRTTSRSGGSAWVVPT